MPSELTETASADKADNKAQGLDSQCLILQVIISIFVFAFMWKRS